MNFKNPYSSDKIVYCVAVVVRKHGGNFTIKAHFGVVNSTSHGPIKSEAKYEPWQAKIACPQVIEIRLQNGVKPYLKENSFFSRHVFDKWSLYTVMKHSVLEQI